MKARVLEAVAGRLPCAHTFLISLAESDSTIFMVGTMAPRDVPTPEVQPKAAAAARWRALASNHATTVGTKRWKHLLVPHDEIAESRRLSDHLRFEAKAGDASMPLRSSALSQAP